MTISTYADKHKYPLSSFRNTIYGNYPIIEVAQRLKEEDNELFQLLPQKSKDILDPAKRKEARNAL